MLAAIFSALFLGLIPALIASSKGRNFLIWYVYGIFLFIIALIHSLIIKGAEQKLQEVILLKAVQDMSRSSNADASGIKISIADELEKLATLRDRGVITPEEFNQEKRDLLS